MLSFLLAFGGEGWCRGCASWWCPRPHHETSHPRHHPPPPPANKMPTPHPTETTSRPAWGFRNCAYWRSISIVCHACNNDTFSCLRFVAPPILTAKRCPGGLFISAVCVFLLACEKGKKIGDYSSPIIKFSMYRERFSNRSSFATASSDRRTATTFFRPVRGRPAPGRLPPRFDFFSFISD